MSLPALYVHKMAYCVADIFKAYKYEASFTISEIFPSSKNRVDKLVRSLKTYWNVNIMSVSMLNT